MDICWKVTGADETDLCDRGRTRTLLSWAHSASCCIQASCRGSDESLGRLLPGVIGPGSAQSPLSHCCAAAALHTLFAGSVSHKSLIYRLCCSLKAHRRQEPADKELAPDLAAGWRSLRALEDSCCSESHCARVPGLAAWPLEGACPPLCGACCAPAASQARPQNQLHICACYCGVSHDRRHARLQRQP